MAYELRRHPTYSEAIEKLGGASVIELPLRILEEAIETRPDAFDIVPPHITLRKAQSDPIRMLGRQIIPPLRLFFRIDDERTVTLLWIERVPDDEQAAYGEEA